MIVPQLLLAVLALCVDQLFTSRYGALGVVCLFLLGAGVRARDSACVYTGAVIFLLLMVQA
ncbi:hypothetical protein WB401_44540 [Streptomyces brasiliscabiei]|uniref:Rod shape-determining protein MreD n=2 Tax=Streptomyces TaxID=1883 RepID=A0ABU8GTK7_9ACTN|nr:hypothetical protein [Streptomyces griseiscabiei]MBZ3907869.1 hypothetical protein [Streptomyces griseiscabiei]MDX2915239.1 hypothetical protein [Streptomyces griseiscabiei]